jgi:hypothetical protein
VTVFAGERDYLYVLGPNEQIQPEDADGIPFPKLVLIEDTALNHVKIMTVTLMNHRHTPKGDRGGIGVSSGSTQ